MENKNYGLDRDGFPIRILNKNGYPIKKEEFKKLWRFSKNCEDSSFEDMKFNLQIIDVKNLIQNKESLEKYRNIIPDFENIKDWDYFNYPERPPYFIIYKEIIQKENEKTTELEFYERTCVKVNLQYGNKNIDKCIRDENKNYNVSRYLNNSNVNQNISLTYIFKSEYNKLSWEDIISIINKNYDDLHYTIDSVCRKFYSSSLEYSKDYETVHIYHEYESNNLSYIKLEFEFSLLKNKFDFFLRNKQFSIRIKSLKELFNRISLLDKIENTLFENQEIHIKKLDDGGYLYNNKYYKSIEDIFK